MNKILWYYYKRLSRGGFRFFIGVTHTSELFFSIFLSCVKVAVSVWRFFVEPVMQCTYYVQSVMQITVGKADYDR